MIHNTLIFDIETVADVASYRLLHELHEHDEQDIFRIMSSERLVETGSTFMRHYLHKIVAISVAMKNASGLKVWSLGNENSSEYDIVQRFFQGIEKFSPTLISWNGSGFDLPVLHYRALFHGINAQRYFEIGDNDKDYKFNNYQNRYHWRHLDLMDVLSGYQARSVTNLDDIAKLCGFPGKLAMDGSAVQERYERGDIKGIRQYCETDVLNTYLVYLRFELMRGNLTSANYQYCVEEVETFLQEQDSPHWQAFLQAWMERTV
ncbi:MAG: 3'-5' exonuclease [Cardiobacteriaceae bacterium]|nr:3'-5' exonuclease [Cardiobacteriaceae bacterium]